MHQCAAYVEVVVEGIVQVQAQQSLALLAEGGLVFERHADVGAGINDALVGDSHRSHCVVNSIVTVLGKYHSTGTHHHRAARHVGSIKADGVLVGSLILTLQHKLVLVLHLLGIGQLHGVELLIHILVGNSIVTNHLAQVRAKRLHNGENHLAARGGDCVSVNKVEATVGTEIVVGIQAVEVHHAQQRCPRDIALVDIWQLNAGGVVQVLYVELEV